MACDAIFAQQYNRSAGDHASISQSKMAGNAEWILRLGGCAAFYAGREIYQAFSLSIRRLFIRDVISKKAAHRHIRRDIVSYQRYAESYGCLYIDAPQ